MMIGILSIFKISLLYQLIFKPTNILNLIYSQPVIASKTKIDQTQQLEEKESEINQNFINKI